MQLQPKTAVVGPVQAVETNRIQTRQSNKLMKMIENVISRFDAKENGIKQKLKVMDRQDLRIATWNTNGIPNKNMHYNCF